MGKQPGFPLAAWLGLGLASVIATPPPLLAQSDKPAKSADFPAESPASSDQEPSPTPRPGGLRMSRAVVCRTINGYEDYEPLPDAAQTIYEKLLIYYRPLRYKIDLTDGYYRAHLTQDNEIRKRGDKKILRSKRKVVEYAPKTRQPLGPLYIRNMIDLKGLKPGDYELTIILHDELEKDAPPTKQVVKFKVIPRSDPMKASNKAEGPRPDS
jgi:hypothetical protein